jgi:hypothetical protein
VSESRSFGAAEVAPGVWRWTAAHPEWSPGATPDSTADWERDVGCLLFELDGAVVFVDALVPADEAGFWRWADERCRAAERCHALTTISFHRRSRDLLVDRYDAVTSRARRELPEGLRPIRLAGAGEVMFWLPEQRALIAGDRVLGADGGTLRLCPESWLGYLPSGLTLDELRLLLRPLLDLPIERVLVSHGEPVLAGGREALAKAIG